MLSSVCPFRRAAREPYDGRKGSVLGATCVGVVAKVATMAGLVLACGCDSEATEIRVSAEVSFLVNRSTSSDCGEVQPARLSERNFTITPVDGEHATVRDDNGGCVLDVAVTGRRYHAENARCRLADDSPLRVLGVISRTFELFILDLDEATYAARLRSNVNTTSGERLSCSIDEGRVVREE